MTDSFIIDSDVIVKITKIYQMATYDHLLEGIADFYINEDLLIDIKQRAKRIFYNDHIHIIDSRDNQNESFPYYTIMIELTCEKTFKEPFKDFSRLIIVSFQESWCMPLSNKNIDCIKTIPFKQLCKEMNY